MIMTFCSVLLVLIKNCPEMLSLSFNEEIKELVIKYVPIDFFVFCDPCCELLSEVRFLSDCILSDFSFCNLAHTKNSCYLFGRMTIHVYLEKQI